MTTFATMVPTLARRLADSGKRALYVHGSIYVHPYVFGTCRGRGSDPSAGIVRARYDDYTTYDVVNFPEVDYGGGYVHTLNATAYARGKIWVAYVRPVTPSYQNVVAAVDVETLAVTLYPSAVGTNGEIDCEICAADLGGNYVYFGARGGRSVARFNLNTLAIDAVLDLSAYVTTGTFWHSCAIDATHLYISAGSGDDGLNPGTVHYVVKIRLSDFSYQGRAHVPKATDDMAQHPNWVFIGYEANLRPGMYGYGSGSIAIRKSDMQVFYLPPLGPEDNGNVASYASLVFNNYYIDVKTNYHLYVVDINTDPSTWNTGITDLSEIVLLDAHWDLSGTPIHANAGAGTGAGLPGVDKVPNELLVDIDGHLHCFCWPTGSAFSADDEATNDLTSGLIKGVMPEGFDLAVVPTITTEDADVVGDAVTLHSDILSAGGAAITSQGFYFDTVNPPLAIVNSDTLEQSGAFQATLSGVDVGIHYYQAFSVNSGGEGRGDIKSLGVSTLRGFKGVVRRDGVVRPGAKVYVVDDTTNTIVAEQVVGDDGAYSFVTGDYPDIVEGHQYHLFAVWLNGDTPFRTRVKAYRDVQDVPF